jgi:O-antigen/teichoic acid export membrane protein/lipid II:glycine glycyltransferase (peptidoglycan interpeptide bridge formation enzyme)/uncharacterized membrane protein (UPF0127 family)
VNPTKTTKSVDKKRADNKPGAQVTNTSAGASKIEALQESLRQFLFRNTSDTQTVAKNTVWLSISNFGGRLIKAVVIIAAARILDPIGWGVISYIVTLAGFFTFFVDPGVNVMLMREGSKKSEKEQVELLSTSFYLKLGLIAFAVAFVLFVGPYFTTLPGARVLLPIAALIIVGDTLREFFSSFIRTKEKMEWEAGAFLLTNVCIVVFGLIALVVSPTARSFGWAYAAGTTLGAIATLWILRDYIGRLFSHFSGKLVMPILRSAWPFAITGALGIFLTNADILIISWMRSAYAVGVYSAAVRIIQVLYLFPVIIQYSTLPLLARLADKDNRRFREVLERAIVIIFAVSVPIAFGGLILSNEIMRFVFGAAYASGGFSLALLMLSMIVDYPGGVISLAIFAYDQQKTLIIASIIGGASNVIFDLLLIPHFGITGSAWATLIAQILNNAYLWYVMKRINYFSIAPRLKRIVLASVIMTGVSAFLLIIHTQIILNIVLSVLVYCILLKAMRDPLIADIRQMIHPPKKVSGVSEASGDKNALKGQGIGKNISTLTNSDRTETLNQNIDVGSNIDMGRNMDMGSNIEVAHIATVKIGSTNPTNIQVEVVRDISAIRKGLGDRDLLDENSGMLFIFPQARRYKAWMKGMRFSIDIIWINQGKVVGLNENIQIPTATGGAMREIGPIFQRSPQPATYMLEVNAGFAKKKNIRIGDTVILENISRQFEVISAEKAMKGKIIDRHIWDNFVKCNHPPAGAFLETWEWGEFQKALGHRMERYVIVEYEYGYKHEHEREREHEHEHINEYSHSKTKLVAVFTFACYNLPLKRSYGYLPRGPVILKEYAAEEMEHFEIMLAVKDWARRYMRELAFIRMEPSLQHVSPDMAWHGFRIPSYYIQPPYNAVVPLERSETEILARFHPTTRSNIKRAERRGVTCEIKTMFNDEEFSHFFAMIKSTVGRNHGKNAYPSEHYLRTFLATIANATITDSHPELVVFWGMQDGQPAATHIVIFFGDTAMYLFGASYAHRLNSKVETYLHWSAMREAKRRGMRWYDIGGIDEHIWPSLTSFKRQFGGEELRYVGNIDIPLQPALYYSYNFLRKAAKKMRHQA